MADCRNWLSREMAGNDRMGEGCVMVCLVDVLSFVLSKTCLLLVKYDLHQGVGDCSVGERQCARDVPNTQRELNRSTINIQNFPCRVD